MPNPGERTAQGDFIDRYGQNEERVRLMWQRAPRPGPHLFFEDANTGALGQELAWDHTTYEATDPDVSGWGAISRDEFYDNASQIRGWSAAHGDTSGAPPIPDDHTPDGYSRAGVITFSTSEWLTSPASHMAICLLNFMVLEKPSDAGLPDGAWIHSVPEEVRPAFGPVMSTVRFMYPLDADVDEPSGWSVNDTVLTDWDHTTRILGALRPRDWTARPPAGAALDYAEASSDFHQVPATPDIVQVTVSDDKVRVSPNAEPGVYSGFFSYFTRGVEDSMVQVVSPLPPSDG